jgi:hypothetical protein
MELSFLRDQVKTYFSKSDLRDLCFDLSINYEELEGDSIQDKSRKLVDYCRRHGQVINLIKRCQALRPHVNWRDQSTVNSLLQSDTARTSSSTLMEALSHEISGNLVSIQEFLDKQYHVVGDRICSREREGAELVWFTCMTHTFELAETQKLLTVAEPDLRDRIFEIYRGFRGINDRADALKRVFRPWRASHHIDAVNRFRDELWTVGVQIVEELSLNC